MQPKTVKRLAILPLAVSLALMSACSPAPESTNSTTVPATEQVAQTESEKANALFEQIFMAEVKRSPVMQTRLGIKDDYDKWQDLSDAHYEAGLALTRQHLAQLKNINVDALDDATRISYLLMQRNLEQDLADALTSN